MTMQSGYQHTLMLREQAHFFGTASNRALNDFYMSVFKELITQAKELVKQLPSRETPTGAGKKQTGDGTERNGKDKQQDKLHRSNGKDGKDKRGRDKDRKRPHENGDRGGPSKKMDSTKTYGGMIAKIQKEGVDLGKLFQVKGKCLYCGRENHVAKDCTANLAANPDAQKARDIGRAYFDSK
jgi:hypothetical protein